MIKKGRFAILKVDLGGKGIGAASRKILRFSVLHCEKKKIKSWFYSHNISLYKKDDGRA